MADIRIAKNYLNSTELETLNRIVSMYLDFAELQALSQKPMYMLDWISKLDDFLRISEREILTHAGAISHEEALRKAVVEYEKYRSLHANDPDAVEKHFLDAIKDIKRLENSRQKKIELNKDGGK